MKNKDLIFAIICGLSVTWITFDFFGKYGWIFLFVLPVLSVIGLWLVELVGKKFLFVHQAGKFGLAGAFADVVDIKVFQLVFLFLPFPDVVKAISFIVGTLVKYFSDKYWAFEKHDKNEMHKEMAKFFLVAIIGLAINVVSFNYFGKIKTGLSIKTWQEICIILAAIVTATWNFCGYKFLVFKK